MMRYKINTCYSLIFPKFPNSRRCRVQCVTARGVSLKLKLTLHHWLCFQEPDGGTTNGVNSEAPRSLFWVLLGWALGGRTNLLSLITDTRVPGGRRPARGREGPARTSSKPTAGGRAAVPHRLRFPPSAAPVTAGCEPSALLTASVTAQSRARVSRHKSLRLPFPHTRRVFTQDAEDLHPDV